MQDKKKKKTDFLIPCQEYFLLTYLQTVTLKSFGFLSYFFAKKIPLSRRDGYVMDGSMDEGVSE